MHEAGRLVLDREMVNVDTPYGTVRVKVARRAGKVMNVAPEYEDCREIALRTGTPLPQVLAAVNQSYLKIPR